MEMNYKDLAEFARLGLRFRVLAPASVTAWADGLIAEGDIPDAWLIDLALATKPDAIEEALRHAPGMPQDDLVILLFLGLVLRRWRSGSVGIGDVRGIGWLLHCEEALPTPCGAADWGVRLEVEGEEFDEGWRTKDELCRSIDEKLAQYTDIEKALPTWA